MSFTGVNRTPPLHSEFLGLHAVPYCLHGHGERTYPTPTLAFMVVKGKFAIWASAMVNALNSVLFHLLDNALKYAPEGRINVSAQVQGSTICLQVGDEGAGIPSEALPMLFDRFYRANSADAQSVYGHGLGLYMVRRLVEAMGGRVEAANQHPHGAVFSCWLPLAKDMEEAYDS